MATEEEPAVEAKRSVRMTIFFNKKAEMTNEEFHRYWSVEHAPLFRSLKIVQEKILKYNQFHNSMELRHKAAALGLEVLEFDAGAEFTAAEAKDLFIVFQDPEYLEKVVPDENKFVTREGAKIMIGYDDLMMDKTS